MHNGMKFSRGHLGEEFFARRIIFSLGDFKWSLSIVVFCNEIELSIILHGKYIDYFAMNYTNRVLWPLKKHYISLDCPFYEYPNIFCLCQKTITCCNASSMILKMRPIVEFNLSCGHRDSIANFCCAYQLQFQDVVTMIRHPCTLPIIVDCSQLTFSRKTIRRVIIMQYTWR